jgi:predicted nucleotidyltransferase
MPDLDRARRFLAAHPPPGTLIQCGVTGAHYYGFPSDDSDVDLKGIHLAPTPALLGLDAPRETHDVLTIFEGVEHDLTTHEAGKALALLLRGNGNVLERIASPIQVTLGPDADALRELALGAVSKRFAPHYRGYFEGMCREHARSEAPRAKSLLYAYRVALTGVHLLRTGEVRGDVIANASEHGVTDVEELVRAKRESGEKSAIDPALDAKHRARWPMLAAMLDDALAKSTLPDEPSNRAAIHEWLVQRRLAAL